MSPEHWHIYVICRALHRFLSVLSSFQSMLFGNILSSSIIVVACFNAVECVCILWIILRNNGPTLCILGDAIAEFLKAPDICTENLGITSMQDFKHCGKTWSMSQGRRVLWQPSRIRWREAASARRWIFAIVT